MDVDVDYYRIPQLIKIQSFTKMSEKVMRNKTINYLHKNTHSLYKSVFRYAYVV